MSGVRKAEMKATQVETLVAALERLGGEASVHDLWRTTRMPVLQIDRVLLTSLSRRHPPAIERTEPLRRGNHEPHQVADRRWRLRRPAP